MPDDNLIHRRIFEKHSKTNIERVYDSHVLRETSLVTKVLSVIDKDCALMVICDKLHMAYGTGLPQILKQNHHETTTVLCKNSIEPNTELVDFIVLSQ